MRRCKFYNNQDSKLTKSDQIHRPSINNTSNSLKSELGCAATASSSWRLPSPQPSSPTFSARFVQDFQVKWSLSFLLPPPGARRGRSRPATARQPWWRGGSGGSRWCSPPRRRSSTRCRGTARLRRRRSRCASAPASSASPPGAAPSSGSSHPSSPSPRLRSGGSRSSPARLYVPPVSTRARTQLFVANLHSSCCKIRSVRGFVEETTLAAFRRKIGSRGIWLLIELEG
jgi:hypothetical protein